MTEHAGSGTDDQALRMVVVAELAKSREHVPREVDVTVSLPTSAVVVRSERGGSVMTLLVFEGVALDKRLFHAVGGVAALIAKQTTVAGVDDRDADVEHAGVKVQLGCQRHRVTRSRDPADPAKPPDRRAKNARVFER